MAHGDGTSLPPLLPTPSLLPRSAAAAMASLPPPASHKLRDSEAVESRSPKRHRPLGPEDSGSHREPSLPPSSRRRAEVTPPPPPSNVRRRSRSPSPSKFRRQSRSPPPYKVRRRSRSPSPSKVRHRSRSSPPSKSRRRSRSPPPSNVRRRSRSPPPYKSRRLSRSPPPSRLRRRSRSPPSYKSRRRTRSPPPSSNVRRRSRSPSYLSSTQRLAERRHAKGPSAEAAVEGERARPSSLDESLMENRPSHSNCNGKHPETSSAVAQKIPDPAIRGDGQKLDYDKMDRKNQSDDKAPSRNARRKKMRRQAKKEMVEAPSGNGSRKKTKRQIWAEAKKEFREMKKDKLLENIKKLQSCVWLLEKDGADTAEIMEFRSMLESTKKQYVENEAQLAKEGSSAPIQVLIRDRLEKTAVSGQNESAKEVNRLRTELETVRQDRDYQLAQAQSLMADVAKQKEVARRYGIELEDAMRRVAALEEGCLSRRESIKALHIQLASANETLAVPSPARD